MQYLYCDPTIATKSPVTIFTIPKPFVGEIATIQRNAIISWTQLTPQPEIILFGDEPGTSEIAREFGLICVPEIQRNQHGTPLLGNVFAEAHCRSNCSQIAYVNADIILMDDFLTAVSAISQKLDKFLTIGRRWNIDRDTPIDFSANWREKLRRSTTAEGSLACYQCKDYFVFPRGLFEKIPNFAVGRGYWDTWMVNYANEKNYPVVDASLGVMAIHQNHGYRHVSGGKNEAYIGKEAEQNKSLANYKISGTIADATWQLKPARTKNLPQVSIILTLEGDPSPTIASILAQKYDNLEIIAIASPQTQVKIPEDRSSLSGKAPPIKYIQLETTNKLVAYNQGLKIARGELVMFIDGGCLLLPNALNNAVNAFDVEASTLDILLSGWQFVGNGRSIKTEPWLNLTDLADLHIWKLREIYQPLSSSSVVFRRKLLQIVGGFNPRLSFPAATVEIILALVFLKGSRAKWLEKSTVSVSANYLREIHLLTNLDLTLEKTVNLFYQRREIKPWMLTLQPEAKRAISASVSLAKR